MKQGLHIKEGRTVRGKRFWVVLVAANGEVLSHSEMLNSRQAAEKNLAAQRSVVDEQLDE